MSAPPPTGTLDGVPPPLSHFQALPHALGRTDPGDTCVSFGGFLGVEGEGYFRAAARAPSPRRVASNLSDGVLIYEGAPAVAPTAEQRSFLVPT